MVAGVEGDPDAEADALAAGELLAEVWAKAEVAQSDNAAAAVSSRKECFIRFCFAGRAMKERVCVLSKRFVEKVGRLKG